MKDILRSIWTSRDRRGLLWACVTFMAGVLTGGVIVATLTWAE